MVFFAESMLMAAHVTMKYIMPSPSNNALQQWNGVFGHDAQCPGV
jgi:hypothetical protein